jgi:hypothetical protein
VPSPLTTRRHSPSRLRRTRGSWPLSQGPTRPSGGPAVVKTRSAPPQLHGPRLRVAGRLASTWRHRVARRSCPRGCHCRRHCCWGQAPRICPGMCLSQGRTRLRAWWVRPPHLVGHIPPKLWPHSFPTVFSRHWTSAATVSGRPTSLRACSRACRGRCARAGARWRRSRYVCERRGVAWYSRRWARGMGARGSSAGVGWGVGGGNHGATFRSFQELSRHPSRLCPMDGVARSTRKSQNSLATTKRRKCSRSGSPFC